MYDSSSFIILFIVRRVDLTVNFNIQVRNFFFFSFPSLSESSICWCCHLHNPQEQEINHHNHHRHARTSTWIRLYLRLKKIPHRNRTNQRQISVVPVTREVVCVALLIKGQVLCNNSVLVYFLQAEQQYSSKQRLPSISFLLFLCFFFLFPGISRIRLYSSSKG